MIRGKLLMEEIIKNIELYDLIARALTGITVIILADFAGIYTSIRGENAVSIWIVVVLGYCIGIILEEISYIIEIITDQRKKIKKEIADSDEYRKYSYDKCKRQLIRNGHQNVLDYNTTHIVMSSSLCIGTSILLIIKGFIVLSKGFEGWDNKTFDVPVLVVLLALSTLFYFRKRHYSVRYVEQIFENCITMNYDDIYLDKYWQTDEQNT